MRPGRLSKEKERGGSHEDQVQEKAEEAARNENVQEVKENKSGRKHDT